MNRATRLDVQYDAALLRQQGGQWLRYLRESANLSQKDLAQALGCEYYSFISQIESGRGRVPAAQMEAWARAVRVPRDEFAKGILKYYEARIHDMLFSEGDDSADAAPSAPHRSNGNSKVQNHRPDGSDPMLETVLRRLENLEQLAGLQHGERSERKHN